MTRTNNGGHFFDYEPRKLQVAVSEAFDTEVSGNRTISSRIKRGCFLPSPSQPPIKTKPNNCYVAKLVEPYCHCDYHLYEPEMGRYMKLAEKEKALYEELDILKKRVRKSIFALCRLI